ncbi:tyrosine-type recombinase/integrase [Caballeronia sp. LZ062]|uniref:tyrosine-type recombinase/integrase n=1 Tax=unclassified Caballeronia TaxID=2646786 RepID=UPI00285428E7|nr:MULTISPECIES: tyrosine-type recombinase/integrase [unclassified Caballeronia]MDR5855493.1 tyrosine-type recombinase/integrase [Caballeronia sp. LZ050]MDR5869981.1 tyrosine-type recombinase/integrase [Caballeronia sp. LZ062]
MKNAKALTASTINAAKPKDKPYKLSDLNRLSLTVSKVGTKSWSWAYRLDGQDRTYQIGRWPKIGLAEARARRAEAEKLVKAGIHPKAHDGQQVAQTMAEQATTFWGVMAEWIDINRPKWSSSYLDQVERFAGRYIRDAEIGKRPLRSLTSADIYGLTRSIGARGKTTGTERKAGGAPSIATLIKMWCSGVFRLGIASGRCDNNPAAGFKLSDVVAKPPTKNNRPLDADELKRLLSKLKEYRGQRTTIIAIKLLLLTFVRTIELRAATWPEFDLENALWTIPADRMKRRLPHVVPLSAQAVTLLTELKQLTGTKAWLFPNRRDDARYMSATTINRALEYMGFAGRDSIGFTAHGARGTASTYLHEEDFNPKHVDRQLAHVEKKKVVGTYNKAQYLKQRRVMMQEYADYISEQGLTI